MPRKKLVVEYLGPQHGIPMACLNVEDLTDAQVFAVVGSTSLLYKAGSLPQMLAHYRIEPTDMLRFVLGVTAASLAIERRRIAEALVALTLGEAFARQRTVPFWVEHATWVPRNENATDLPIHDSVLDLDFLDRFGLTDKVWEQHVFKSDVFTRQKRSLSTPEDRVRMYVALRAVGFLAPAEFFCRPTPRSAKNEGVLNG